MEALLGAKLVSLNHLWTTDSPVLGLNPPYRVEPALTHNTSGEFLPAGMSAASFALQFSGQHGAPTVDALGHIGVNNTVYTGEAAADINSPTGLTKLGIDEYPEDKYINRGVLIGIPYCLSGMLDPWSPPLPQFYAVSDEEIISCAAQENAEIKEGDSVLIRTGWGPLFASDPLAYGTNQSGVLAGSGAQLLADAKIFLTGTDTLTYDAAGTPFPAHITLIAQRGI